MAFFIIHETYRPRAARPPEVVAVRAGTRRRVEALARRVSGRQRLLYRLDQAGFRPPFHVEALWHDGRCTYLRSRA